MNNGRTVKDLLDELRITLNHERSFIQCVESYVHMIARNNMAKFDAMPARVIGLAYAFIHQIRVELDNPADFAIWFVNETWIHCLESGYHLDNPTISRFMEKLMQFEREEAKR